MSRKINIIGGGPAGLFMGYLLKRDDPTAKVTLFEQNPDGATWGFGVVFSDRALDFLQADDPDTHDLIAPHMERWQNMTLVHQSRRVTLDGIGFAAIGRLELIGILQDRAQAVGVDIRHETHVSAVESEDADLIIGADGLNSVVRGDGADFGMQIDHFSNRFAWFGTPRSFDTLTQTFIKTPQGAMNAHHYRYQPQMSTFIVECDADSFFAHGFDQMDEDETAALCQELFADTLEGAPLVANKSIWRQFPRLWCKTWVSGNRALIGDAVHTAHFSIGSGTRLAMEDAMALAEALRAHGSISDALAAYDTTRRPIAKKIVDAANTSATWYEGFRDKMALPPMDFAFDYITRSGRVDMARLRQLSPAFMAAYEAGKRVDAS